MTLEQMVIMAPRVYIIGNGGSYANAVHICNDLLLVGKPAFTLDPATLTCSANDFGYASVFERWLDVVGSPGELLIALSGSGRSPNILRGVAAAERKEMMVWKEFGALKGMDMQTSEELQLFLGHNLLRALRATK